MNQNITSYNSGQTAKKINPEQVEQIIKAIIAANIPGLSFNVTVYRLRSDEVHTLSDLYQIAEKFIPT